MYVYYRLILANIHALLKLILSRRIKHYHRGNLQIKNWLAGMQLDD